MNASNGYGQEEKEFAREMGQTIDALVDQVNDLTDAQDRIGSRLEKV